jgi:hypothetical protein
MTEFQKRFEERLDEVRRTDKSNCIGTALYLVGEQGTDKDISPELAYPIFLRNFQEIENPIEGCLAAWQQKMSFSGWLRQAIGVREWGPQIPHLGVITDTNPLLITHRAGLCERVVEGDEFSEVRDRYIKNSAEYFGKVEIVYYLPRDLASSLTSDLRENLQPFEAIH